MRNGVSESASIRVEGPYHTAQGDKSAVSCWKVEFLVRSLSSGSLWMAQTIEKKMNNGRKNCMIRHQTSWH